MFLLEPLNPIAASEAYEKLHSYCSSIQYFDNGMILIETMRIQKVREIYGQDYKVVGQML